MSGREALVGRVIELAAEVRRCAETHHVRSDARDILAYEAADLDAVAEALRNDLAEGWPQSTLLGPWGRSVHGQVGDALVERVRALWRAVETSR